MNEKTYQIVINEMELMASVGIHDHEKDKKQRLIINAELDVLSPTKVTENINDVVSYSDIISRIKTRIQEKHTDLLETLAQKIIKDIFEDSRVFKIKLEILKPDIYKDCKSVGVVFYVEKEKLF